MIHAHLFTCARCKELARWFVWYVACGGVYGHLCNDCAAIEMRDGHGGYSVTQLQLFPWLRDELEAEMHQRLADENWFTEAITTGHSEEKGAQNDS